MFQYLSDRYSEFVFIIPYQKDKYRELNHPQQESLSVDELSSELLGPTTDSSHFPLRLPASFQMHPQPMFVTVMASPRQFFAHDVQFVQSSGLAMTAGPSSGSSQTLNGQTSRHIPQRLHRAESYPNSSLISCVTTVTLYHHPMIITRRVNPIRKTAPIFNVNIKYGYSLLITFGSLTDVIPDQSMVKDTASMN